MLVLSRRINESIKIGRDITITIVKLTKGRVRIGIDAPPDFVVLRTEVWDSIQETTNAL